MKFRRFFRLSPPLLLLGLIWHFHDQAATTIRSLGQDKVTEVSRKKPPVTVNPAAPTEFLSWAEHYQNAPGPELLRHGLSLAQERRETLKVLIEIDPKRALELAVSDPLRQTLPAEITALLEVPISAAGEFERIVTCYTGALERPVEVPAEERFVTIDNRRYRAFTYGRRAEMQSKDRISLAGIALDDALALSPDPVRRIETPHGILAEAFGEQKQFADEDELDRYVTQLIVNENAPGPGDASPALDDEEFPIAENAWTEGTKRILYLRVRFSDQDPEYEPVTLALAQSHQDDVAEAFRIASYGKTLITTEFTDVINLAQDKSQYVGQGLGNMMNEARSVAVAMGQAQGKDWDYNNYDLYTVVSDSGIGSYSGVAQVGGRKSHLQSTSLRTAGHEFGHNLGLSHAYYNYTSDLNPRGSTPNDGLGRVEYGHRFSMMSAQSGSDFENPLLAHFTVHEKWQLNWLTDNEFTDITAKSQSGTYRLYQNDDENATGLLALRVPSGGILSNYWLSYRSAWRTPNRSANNEYLLNGIVFDWTGSNGGSSTLLDMTPYSDDGSTGGPTWTRDNNDKWDAPLLIGRTYTDPDSLLSVTPIARGGSAPDEYLDVYVHLAAPTENTLVGQNETCRAIIPDELTATGLDWTAPVFDDSSWPYSGLLGVGYDNDPDYQPYINLDVSAGLENTSESCYIRIPFNFEGDPADIVALKLKMRYDDGFVAYLNGVKVAEANAPLTPLWNSGATSAHSDGAAIELQEFSIDSAAAALLTGHNVLAIHGLNDGSDSSDFLIQPELVASFALENTAPPTVSLSASTLFIGVDQDVTFTASGSDADGDTLSYSWDFDIGNTFAPEGLNQPLAHRSWSTPGVYAVTVTCSDRKGGLARDQVIITVGEPPHQGSINGRVLQGGQPVAGARVFIAESDRQTLTLADGSYFFGGLPDSPVTIGAMLDGEIFRPSLTMPVTPQPAVEGLDFLGHASLVTGAPSQSLTLSPHLAFTKSDSTVQLTARLWDNTLAGELLVPLGDTWRCLDTGVAPDDTWIDLEFDDASWFTGVAELGYGDTQTTVVSYGDSFSNKYITTWFRRKFTAGNLAEISSLKLSLKRDDGIRVFLNGTEIARDNLTTGTVSASTKASHEISAFNEETLLHYLIDPALLIAGENIIAAEVHLEDDNSYDLSFDLELSASRNLTEVSPTWTVDPPGASVSPSGEFSVTIPGTYTVTATSGDLSATSTITTDNSVSITASSASVYENEPTAVTLQVSRLGSTTAALEVPLLVSGDATSGTDFQALPASVIIPAGEITTELTLTIIDDSQQEGTEIISIAPAINDNFSIGLPASASVTIIDDDQFLIRIPKAGPDRGATTAVPLQLAGSITSYDPFISLANLWKYHDGKSEPSNGWRNLAFNDSTWKEGSAKFGYGDNNETTTVSSGTSFFRNNITSYYRRTFTLTNPTDYTDLIARVLVDDGAIIYLNGSEVQRINMPGGNVTYSTRASTTVAGTDETTYFDWSLDPADLIAGENIIVVEVHQSSPSSPDLGFALTLTAKLAISPPTTSLWTQASGPGIATFVNDQDLETTVDFDTPGTYVLTLTAGDQSDQITVTVVPQPSYSQWVAGFPLADSSPLADPDFDGTINLLEYASFSDPSDNMSFTNPHLESDPAVPGDLVYTYRRIREISPGDGNGSTGDGYRIYGITYTVEVSSDLSNWQPASQVVTMQAEGLPLDYGDGSETVTLRLTPPPNSGNHWFARLKIALE
ncbi:PKD domain-containing protein [Verrucomicrobiaceae bacterium 227]